MRKHPDQKQLRREKVDSNWQCRGIQSIIEGKSRQKLKLGQLITSHPQSRSEKEMSAGLLASLLAFRKLSPPLGRLKTPSLGKDTTFMRLCLPLSVNTQNNPLQTCLPAKLKDTSSWRLSSQVVQGGGWWVELIVKTNRHTFKLYLYLTSKTCVHPESKALSAPVPSSIPHSPITCAYATDLANQSLPHICLSSSWTLTPLLGTLAGIYRCRDSRHPPIFSPRLPLSCHTTSFDLSEYLNLSCNIGFSFSISPVIWVFDFLS